MSRRLLVIGAIIAIASAVSRAAFFIDDFDADSSADWNINASSADTSVIFAFDYSTIGVPPAPNGGGTTLGLRMAVNINAPGTTEAVTLSPVGREFTGSYTLKFDMWINANGPFPGGGTGSTEFVTAGIGYDDLTINIAGAGSGGWFAVSGEGGTTRDYRAYKNAGEQFAESTQFLAGRSSAGGGAHNNSDPYYAQFGGFDVAAAVPAQTLLYPKQTGTIAVGAVGFAWHEVTITVDGETALWEIDGLPIVKLDTRIGSTFPVSGNISVGYMDIFTSVSDNPEVSFGLIDNLVVLPDASAAFLAHTPTPPDNAKLVSTTQTLQWHDPIEISPVAYDVYLRIGDPNFGQADKVIDYLLVNSCQPPSGQFEPETLYFWRVDSYDPNEGGNPARREGHVWTFQTAPPEPLIQQHPARVVTVPAGDPAQLSVTAVNADTYAWYKLTDDGPQIVPGADSDTLRLDHVTLDDEGYYYCSVTNETAVVVSSDPGRILTRRKMAHWKFDDNLDDEVDPANNGVSPGAITYGAGVDGQAVRIAEPDQFVQINNAIGLLNEVSVSLWINPPASVLSANAVLIVPQEGAPNYGGVGSVSLTTAANRFHAQVRSGGVNTSAGTITADTWNHLLFVYAPPARQADFYVNGRHVSTVTGIDPGVLPNLTALGIGIRNPSEIVDVFEQGLIDDIRIYNFALSSLNAASLYTEFAPDDSVCLDGVLPQYDLNGDCIFNLKDFAEIAATWLECNLVPDCVAPDIP